MCVFVLISSIMKTSQYLLMKQSLVYMCEYPYQPEAVIASPSSPLYPDTVILILSQGK